MKIDMEQFLALTVALGCAGAVGYAVYADRAEMSEIVAGAEELDPPLKEPDLAEEAAQTAPAPGPMPTDPTDLDDAAGIPPVVPDDPNGYAPGPTTETGPW